MIAQPVITDIADILNDVGHVTYTEPKVIAAINDAQRAVCIYRPDASSSTLSVALVVGSKQSLPATARRLMDVTRNMGADGLTVGPAIRKVDNMDNLDSYDPNWHTATGSNVAQYVYDEKRPNEFYIYPTVSTPHYIEIKTADRPTDLTLATDNIDIDDIYAPCLVSWSVYRLLSSDSTESPNHQRAMEHKDTFFNLLGIKTQADAAVAPE